MLGILLLVLPPLGAWLFANSEPDFVRRFSVFFGNLHSHTAFSDGSGFPDEAYHHAKNEGGLDFMAITEHNHTNHIRPKDPAGGDTIGTDHSLYVRLQAAAARNRDSAFIAFFGQEFSSISSGNHLNVFSVREVIDDGEVPNGEYRQLYEEWLPAHAEVEFIQFNHPWELGDRGKNYGLRQFGSSPRKLREATEKYLRTIEVINGPGLADGAGLAAKLSGERFYKGYLTRGFHIAPSADQDNHHRTWGTLTDARTAVLAADLTHAALSDAILNRRCYATTDKNLRIWFGVNGSVMGSDIRATSRRLKVSYKIEDQDEPHARYDLRLVLGNPDIADSETESRLEPIEGDQASEIDFTTPHNSTFIYLKVTQQPRTESKKDVAVTSPVWIRVQ